MWMWGIAVLGLALVAGSIGFMLYEAAAGDSSPADITVQVDATLQIRNGYLVKFRAINTAARPPKVSRSREHYGTDPKSGNQ